MHSPRGTLSADLVTALQKRARAVLRDSLVGLLGFLAAGGVLAADPLPLSKADQAKIDHSIRAGVASLRGAQRPNGLWDGMKFSNVGHAGYTLLPALTLLECGVPATDKGLQRTGQRVRDRADRLEWTYDISLALLFLDRLGERQDEKVIRKLALRLVAGQSRGGGWTYKCPKLSESQETALLDLLQQLDNSSRKARGAGDLPEPHIPNVPKDLKSLTVFQPLKEFSQGDGNGPPTFTGPTDNSNTQFALLALWAARRHGVPLGPTARWIVKRFEASEFRDGGWGYRIGMSVSVRSMTTVGLLGLAIGHGLRAGADEKRRAARDPRIERGFARLYLEIGHPTGKLGPPLPLTDVYFLWSVERVAALYNLPAIADKDWYRWGAELLLANQDREIGNWPLASNPFVAGRDCFKTYNPILNTSFALLFLKRTNLTKDLTANLPFDPKALNAGITGQVRLRPVREQAPVSSPGTKKP